jgi:hypothetical protein
MINLLLMVLAAIWATQEARGVGGTPVLVDFYGNIDCSGPAVNTEVLPLPLGACLSNAFDGTGLINGAPVSWQSIQFNCPGKTFSYGAGPSCNSSAIPLDALCIQNPGDYAVKIRCLPDICRPDSGLPKPRCDNYIATCAQWGFQMKW